MKAPRWLVATYVGLQVGIPALGLLLRWAVLDGRCLMFTYQMYACGCTSPGC